MAIIEVRLAMFQHMSQKCFQWQLQLQRCWSQMRPEQDAIRQIRNLGIGHRKIDHGTAIITSAWRKRKKYYAIPVHNADRTTLERRRTVEREYFGITPKKEREWRRMRSAWETTVRRWKSWLSGVPWGSWTGWKRWKIVYFCCLLHLAEAMWSNYEKALRKHKTSTFLANNRLPQNQQPFWKQHMCTVNNVRRLTVLQRGSRSLWEECAYCSLLRRPYCFTNGKCTPTKIHFWVIAFFFNLLYTDFPTIPWQISRFPIRLCSKCAKNGSWSIPSFVTKTVAFRNGLFKKSPNKFCLRERRSPPQVSSEIILPCWRSLWHDMREKVLHLLWHVKQSAALAVSRKDFQQL